MNHLTEERIYQHIFAADALNAQEIEHLAGCEECQSSLQSLTSLNRELIVAAQSTPRPQTLNSYYQLFEQIQTNPSILVRSVQWIKAQLQWDSRQQPALQGVRGTGSPSYRILYSSEVADVELLVEARNGNRWIDGEIIPLTEGDLQFPALLQFSNQSDNQVVAEVESDLNGRFRVESLTPGNYSFSLMPRQGAHLQFETLGLT